MRILLTGVSGFIGSALSNQLYQDGHSVKAAVRRCSSSLPPGIRQFLVGDLSPSFDWTYLLAGVDIVIHLAARAHVLKKSDKDSLQVLRDINTLATLNFARQAEKAGVKRFIFVSSIGVNGNQTFETPFTADDDLNIRDYSIDTEDFRSDYAISKYEAELGLNKIAAQSLMQVVNIRPPLVYWSNAPGNFGQLLKVIRLGIPLPLGGIKNKRSLVALPNLIDFIITCIDHPEAANQTFLVSDGEDLSTTELLKRLSTELGKPSRLFSVPTEWIEAAFNSMGRPKAAQSLCHNLQVDINKNHDLLCWSPPLSLDVALHRTCKAYQAIDK